MFGWEPWVAKTFSVISATFLNYYLNKTWTWGHSNRDNKRFAKYLVLYALSGFLNVVSNEVFRAILPDNEFQMFIMNKAKAMQAPFLTIKLDKLLAVLGATCVGLIINFLGQKLWVFKGKTPENDSRILDDK